MGERVAAKGASLGITARQMLGGWMEKICVDDSDATETVESTFPLELEPAGSSLTPSSLPWNRQTTAHGAPIIIPEIPSQTPLHPF